MKTLARREYAAWSCVPGTSGWIEVWSMDGTHVLQDPALRFTDGHAIEVLSDARQLYALVRPDGVKLKQPGALTPMAFGKSK